MIRQTTTMSDVFPYILSVLGIAALLTIGRGHWWGWGIAFTNECLWIMFAITTEQYGFLLGAFAYGAVNVYNAVRWHRGWHQKGRQTH